MVEGAGNFAVAAAGALGMVNFNLGHDFPGNFTLNKK
jgi:hypothetical protein